MKENKVRIIAIVLMFLLIIAMVYKFYNENKKEEEEPTTVREDAKRFKEEYESLNGKKNSNDTEYLTVNISENNAITYKTDEEIIDILKSSTGVVYFGYNSCPWCRSMVETMLKSLDTNNVSKVYYVDIKDIRSSYEVENRKLIKTNEGTESYYEILSILNEYLTDYKITDSKKEYDTKEKRLYAPTVVAVKNGQIIGFHEGTVESMTDPYQGLTKEEQEELYKTFNNMFAELNDSTCDDEKTRC